jgi:hypothetical protein
VGNGWLEITVNATERTNLATPDVFYFGNLIGETGGTNAVGTLGVNSIDVGRVRAAQLASQNASISNAYDFNRDGRVNVLDTGIVRSSTPLSIPLLSSVRPAATAQAAGAPATATAEVVRTGGAAPARGRYLSPCWDERLVALSAGAGERRGPQALARICSPRAGSSMSLM